MIYRMMPIEEFYQRIDEILLLHDIAFRPGMKKEDLIWKYTKNPLENAYFAVGEYEDKIVAFFGAIPLIVIDNGFEIRAAQTQNFMVDPSFAGNGIGKAIFNFFLEQLRLAKIQIVFGFPNDISNRLHNRNGYRTVAEIPQFCLDIKSFPDNNECDLEFDNSFNHKYMEQYENANLLHLQKKCEYLRWRYFENPENKYENIVIKEENIIIGYAVCKIWNRRLNLVEFHIRDTGYVLNKLLDSVVKYAKIHGCFEVSLWNPVSYELHCKLEQIGFKNTTPVNYFNVAIFDDKLDQQKYWNPHNWSVQMADDNTY